MHSGAEHARALHDDGADHIVSSATRDGAGRARRLDPYTAHTEIADDESGTRVGEVTGQLAELPGDERMTAEHRMAPPTRRAPGEGRRRDEDE